MWTSEPERLPPKGLRRKKRGSYPSGLRRRSENEKEVGKEGISDLGKGMPSGFHKGRQKREGQEPKKLESNRKSRDGPSLVLMQG